VYVDGYIYCCYGGPFSVSRSATLRCLDLITGKLRWEAPLGSDRYQKRSVQLITAAGKLIILSDMGILSIADASPDGYREISRCDVLAEEKEGYRNFATPPVLCNGKIYCRDYGGELICIEVRK